MAEKWTKTSSPPESGAMKPKPFSALNHLTVPEAMSDPLSCSRVGATGPFACHVRAQPSGPKPAGREWPGPPWRPTWEGSALLAHGQQLGPLEGLVGLLLEEEPEPTRRDRAAHAGDDGDDDDEEDDHDRGTHVDSLASARTASQRASIEPSSARGAAVAQEPVWAQASISMSACSGSSDTAMADRAGRWSPKAFT